MNLKLTLTLSFALIISTSANANELPTCNLKAFYNPGIESNSPTYDIKGLGFQKRHLVHSEESENNNDFRMIPVNDALVNAEIRPTVLKPTQDFKYKANFLTQSFNFKSDQEYMSLYKFTNPEGLNYDVLTYDSQYYIFVGEDGIPCNKVAYINKPSSVVVIHKYSLEPAEARFEKSLSESNEDTTGIRIIYLGLDKGAMKFQATLVDKGKITDSKAFSFDQFAKQIEIAGVNIQVSKASSDSIMAKVEQE